MNVVRYQSWDELQSLATSWNALLTASSSDTVFLTWDWCQAWWKNYGGDRSLFVLAAWEGNKLAGIAPFYLDNVRRWGATWACLRVIGDGSKDSDYLDCFARVGYEGETIRAFVEFLENCQSSWDWLEITGVPQNSACLAALVQSASQRGWRSVREAIPCATLALPKQWGPYLHMLHPRFRTKVRSSLADIECHLGSIPRECCQAEEIDAWLSDLFDLHSRRWERSGQPGVFGDPAKRSFYQDVSHAALRRGWLAFHRMAWGERPLALQYGFRYHNRFYLLQEGYDPAFEGLRPGIALRAWLMRHWIEEGLEEYDFLAGNAAHKLNWGAQQKVTYRLLLACKRRGAWLSMDVPRAYGELRERARGVTPKPLFSWRREFLAWRARRHWRSSDQVPTPFSRRVMRWSASHLYSHTPLGPIARHLANEYAWNSAKSWLPQGRSLPVCQIFIYHRVNDDRDPFFYSLPVAQFRAQMEHFARNFRFITLDQIAQEAFPANGKKFCVAITFDDGYRDNFLHAFPILKEMGIPAAIFLTTGCIESGELPWYDQVRLALKLTQQSRISLRELGGPDFLLGDQSTRLDALQQTLTWLRRVNEAVRLRCMDELFKQLRVSANPNLPHTMLSWDEVHRMSKQGVTFGAHTVTHPALATLPSQRLRDEILGSKNAIEDRLQLPVRHFAYPFGKPSDYGEEAKRAVQAAGFETAVTTVYGVNSSAQDRFQLKRFCLREPDRGIFGLKLDWHRMVAQLGQAELTSISQAELPSVSKEEWSV